MSTIVKFNNVSKSINNQVLYTDVNIKIKSGEKILLCGANGCGKTTFVRLITREIKPDAGTVTIIQGVKISKLEQFENLAINNTVGVFIDNIFDYITSIEKKIREMENEFNNINYTDKVANEYIQLIEQFESVGGYNYLKKKDEFLHTFGLIKLLDRDIVTLSGGEQQYLRLASAIFSDSSLLILDEPFTFLDKGKMLWLLHFLGSIKKTIIVISHDFHMENEFATHIICIRNWKIKKYRNDFELLLEEISSENKRHIQSNTTLNNYIIKREASMAKRKQWMKKAENKHQHAVIIRRLERDIEKARKNKHLKKRINKFNISNMIKNNTNSSREMLINLKNITMTFDETSILDNVSIRIYSNEHYLISGDNGVGKTTLLNIIMKKIAPSKGSVTYPKKIVFASLDQISFDIDKYMTCLDVLSTISYNSKEDWIAGYCEYFDDDFWDKKISVLSGGELKKFFIFICLLKDYDILVLDEPTTFVDIYAKRSIVKMINSCDKCVLMVTHDPYVLKNMMGTKLVICNGKISMMNEVV